MKTKTCISNYITANKSFIFGSEWKRIILFVLLFTSSFKVFPLGNYGTTTEPTATPKQTSNITTKMPTNDWWTSLAWNYYGDNYSGELFADPLSFKAVADGLRVRSQNNATPEAYAYYYDQNSDPTGIQTDFIVSMVSLNATQTRVDAFSDWGVTAEWNDGTRTMKATIGRGFPFAYFTFTRPAGNNVGLYMHAAPSATWQVGNEAIGFTVNGNHYGVFIPTGSSFTFYGNWWESNLDGKNYLAVAALPDNSVATLTYFKNHAFAFINNTTVNWSYNATTSIMTTTYIASVTAMEAGYTTPLMALYRHQWINSTSVNTSYTYPSTARGEMKVFQGTTFTTQMKFNGVLPTLPAFVSGGAYGTNLNSYINSAIAGPAGADTYNAGKWLGRLAQLVQLAEQQGITAQYTSFLNSMKTELEDWFQTGGSKEFRYNSSWGTLIGYPASFATNTELNDHHFHYGYFIMAAAIIARYDQAWAATGSGWGDMVELLIKDAANWNITSDSRFPRLRNFDIYAGHSWASGHGAKWNGNDQESTSEAINFATALILWGTNTCNTTIRDLGIYLYTHEVAATEQYWFDVNNAVFPSGYTLQMVSIVTGNGGQYSIHWDPPGNNVTEIHGIELMPITGGSLYLGRNPTYINLFLNEMNVGSDVGGINGTWRDIFWGMEALTQSGTFNAANALARFNANSGYTPEVGESKAHTYHWINNLNAMGELHPSITGSIPTSAVFVKGGVVTYVAYNPPCNGTITVTFSDGTCMDVTSNQIKASSGLSPCSSLPIRLFDFKASSEDNSTIDLTWTTLWEENNRHFRIERSRDLKEWKEVATVKGSGTSMKTTNYKVTDDSPWPGINYYRLMQVDFDGEETQSAIVHEKLEIVKDQIALYAPTGTGTLVITGIKPEELQSVELINTNGKKITNLNIPKESSSKIELFFPIEYQGIYLVRVTTTETTMVEKIRIQ